MDKPGRAREFTRCSVFFFRVAEFMSVSFLYSLLSFWSSHVSSLSFFLLFFPLDSFITLLCGKPNLSGGRSIILRRNSVAGYVRGGEERGGEGAKDCV